MDKLFHPTFYNECNYLSMLGLTLFRVNERGPWDRLQFHLGEWALDSTTVNCEIILGERYPLKFHTKYLVYTLKDKLLHKIEISDLLSIFSKRPQGSAENDDVIQISNFKRFHNQEEVLKFSHIGRCYSRATFFLTHLPRVPHICVGELCQNWFR